MKPSVVVLGVAIGAWLLGGSEVRKFERSAANDISSKLSGEGRKVAIQSRANGIGGLVNADFASATITASQFSAEELPLFTEPNRNGKGRVRSLRLRLSDFRLGLLEVLRLEADIPDCRFDLPLALKAKQFRLSRAGMGSGSVVIEEMALERFILAKFPEIKSVTVKCDRGWIWVEGFGEFLIIQTHFRVLAKITPGSGSELVLSRARVALDGLPADPVVAEALLLTLNPIIDLDKDLHLHGAIKVRSVETDRGVLIASGDTTIPSLKNEPATSQFVQP